MLEILKDYYLVSNKDYNYSEDYNMDFKKFFSKNVKNYEYYVTETSRGIGKNKGTPWIGIRDWRITKNFTHDFFIMFSFAIKDKIILSFHTNKIKKEALSKLSDEIRDIVDNNIDNGFYFTKDRRELKGINSNKYFFIKVYNCNSLDENLLIKDLNYLIDIYSKLVSRYIQMFPSYEKLIPNYEELLENNKKEYDFVETSKHNHDSFISDMINEHYNDKK